MYGTNYNRIEGGDYFYQFVSFIGLKFAFKQLLIKRTYCKSATKPYTIFYKEMLSYWKNWLICMFLRYVYQFKFMHSMLKLPHYRLPLSSTFSPFTIVS